MSCGGAFCEGRCGCLPVDTSDAEFKANDSRFYNERMLGVFRCEAVDCHMGPDANVYTVTVRAPDGRQRTGHGCVKHLHDVASACLSGVRIEPFE